MSEETRTLIAYRLSRARESLDEASLMLANHHLNAALSRTYYACFYAVNALLLTEDLRSGKHSGVLALFNQHWMATQRLPRELGRFYHQLFDRRQLSDYADRLELEPTMVAAWLTEAQALVERVAEEIAKATP